MPLVASQIFGLILIRYMLELEPLASMPADRSWLAVRADARSAT